MSLEWDPEEEDVVEADDPVDHPHVCDDCGGVWSHIDPECEAELEYTCPDCVDSPTERSI